MLAVRRRAVLGGVARRVLRAEVDDEPDVGVGLGAEGLDGGPVGAEQVVRGECRLGRALAAGGVPPEEVPEHGRDPRLVERDHLVHAVAEAAGDDRGVLGEVVGHVAVEPAAPVVERGREVPVVERRRGRDAGLEQGVHEAVVERKPGLVHGPHAVRQHARPGDAEAVGPEPELGHEADVVRPPAVVVAGDVAGRPVGDPAGLVGEPIPDREARPVGAGRPLDLVRRRRGAPEEAGRERGGAAHQRTTVKRADVVVPSPAARRTT